MDISKEELKDMYFLMSQIRMVDEKIAILLRNNLMRGFTHQCIGQEAIAVGVCKCLRNNDYLATTHRGHGHSLAKSRDIKGLLAELMGREAGFCRGKGGSMHLADTSTGNLGANGIVAGGMPIAVGAALAIKYRGLDNVVVSFFGDAATNQGLFHESVNFAAVNNLPVLFACENNLYGMSLPFNKGTKLNTISEKAAAYGIKGITIDGNDLIGVYQSTCEAIEDIRKGNDPVLIEYLTYRWKGHSINDPAVYKVPGEQEKWLEKDPIKRFRRYMLDHGFVDDEISVIEKAVEDSFEEAMQYAMESPFPQLGEATDHVYA